MKTTVICLLIIALAALGWAYQTHPKAFQKFIADFRNETPEPNPVDSLPSPTNSVSNPAPVVPGAPVVPVVVAPSALPKGAEPVDPILLAPAPVAPAGKAFIAPNPLPKQDDWTWTCIDGKVYTNVIITKVEADCVTIIDSEGGARIDVVQLPDYLKKMLNYDSDLAKVAAYKRAQEMVETHKVLNQEATMVEARNQTVTAQQPVPNPSPASIDPRAVDLQNQITVVKTDMDEKQASADYQDGMFNSPENQFTQQGGEMGHLHPDGSIPFKDAVKVDAKKIQDLQDQLAAIPKTVPPVASVSSP